MFDDKAFTKEYYDLKHDVSQTTKFNNIMFFLGMITLFSSIFVLVKIENGTYWFVILGAITSFLLFCAIRGIAILINQKQRLEKIASDMKR